MKADLASTYGAGVLARPYAEQFGLWLNLDRCWARPAGQVMRGTAAAFSPDDPGRDLFEAISLNDAQGAAWHWASVKARMKARAMAKALQALGG